MPYEEIKFVDTTDASVARLGGLPLIVNSEDWPCNPDTGEPLLLLASITGSFLTGSYPQFPIPEDCCLSVFTAFDESLDYLDKLSVQEASQLEHLQSGVARVILHRRASASCAAPPNAPIPLPMKEMQLELHTEDDTNPDMPDRGLVLPKVGGKPAWGQDPITISGYTYVLQIDEYSIEKLSPDHGGMFEDGTGFLFLKNSLELGDTGVFFIQFV